MSRKPRILLWDIETAHNLVLAHGIYYGYKIAPADILEERYIISGAWRWLDEKKVHGVSIADFERFKKNPHDDKDVVKTLCKVLSEADAVVHHYGDKFDLPMLQGRMLFHKIKPIKNLIKIDTYKIARSRFRLNSNKLDYIAKVLGVPGKSKTEPGLWHRCWQGSRAAVKEMLAYNKQDINVLADVFERLRPFVPAKVNYQLFSDRPVCPSCGSEHINSKGYAFAFTQQRKYKRWTCLDCGHQWRDRKCIKE